MPLLDIYQRDSVTDSTSLMYNATETFLLLSEWRKRCFLSRDYSLTLNGAPPRAQ